MNEMVNALKGCGALQFGEFTLASGAKSNYYVDIKRASTDPKVLYLVSQLMAERMQSCGIKADKIAGVVLGSVPLAAALSLATGIPYVMVRKEKKDHGTGKLIEGVLNKVINLQGIELKTYPIAQTGLSTITVQASELAAGMYFYTLVVNNEIIDTKRMILTQ